MTSKIKSGLMIITAGSSLFAAHAIYSGNPKFYSQVVMPVIQKATSAENSHHLAVMAAKYGLYPRFKLTSPENMHLRVCGMELDNPIGLAAGFDKHCEAIDGLLGIGFGFVEVGAVTPEPQPGNDKPRVFRLTEDKAIINRYGFNSVGHQVAVENFRSWADLPQSKRSCGIVGVNLGKNKSTSDPAIDYVKGVEVFGPVADFLVVNVSSPNTPGLRSLQGQEQLKAIVNAVTIARDSLKCSRKPPIFVKIAPDITEKDCVDIASIVATKDSGVTGLIIANTTVRRPESLKSANKGETGGLSGLPIKDMSTELIKVMYKLTCGRVTIIGVGGVFSGQDALDKIKAGASLVQIYSALGYHGPPIVTKIKQELSALLAEEGYKSVEDAVGADVINNKTKRSDPSS